MDDLAAAWNVELMRVPCSMCSVCLWCSVDALLGIKDGFLSFPEGALPRWGVGDPCAAMQGGANWGGVVCEWHNNANCTTSVSGLYVSLPSQLGDWTFSTFLLVR